MSSGNQKSSLVRNSREIAIRDMYGQRVQKRKVQLGAMQQVHWLKDGERFLVDAHWSEDKFRSSVSQACVGL